ncbi:hypothetical protein [Halolamina sp. C58]|uniref:hypothetical protein n=1 Tax=Halolamina sp. C58 TaxID=3421640 RepID=UPI003EBFF2E4
MSEPDEQAGTDSFWDDVAADDVEIGTVAFVAVAVLVGFSLDIVGFEWAAVAMLGLIAAASATQ